MRPGTVNTENLTTPQLKFTIDVMGMVLDKLIQDTMDLDEAGEPLPIEQQTDESVRQAMQILNYPGENDE